MCAVAFPASVATSGNGSSKELTEWARLSQMIVTSVGCERCLVARQTASGIAFVSIDSVMWKAASISPPPDDCASQVGINGGRDIAVIKNTETGGRISLWRLR